MIDQLVFRNKLDLLLDHYSQLTGREIALRQDVIEMWFEYLSDRLTTEQFAEAVKSWILKNRWFPVPDDLVKQIVDDESHIYDQWLMVVNSGYSTGFSPRQYQEFLDSVGVDCVTARVMEVMGGYRILLETAQKDMSFRRDEFARLYKAYKVREQELVDLALLSQEQRLLEQKEQFVLPPSSTEVVDFSAQFSNLVKGKSFGKSAPEEIDPLVREKNRLAEMKRNKELARTLLEQANLSSPRSSVTDEVSKK